MKKKKTVKKKPAIEKKCIELDSETKICIEPELDETKELFDLLDPSKRTLERIKQYIKEQKDSFILLVILSSKEYSELNMDLLEYFLKIAKIKGSYVTLNRPATDLVKEMKRRNINDEKLIVLDGISKISDRARVEKKNYLYTDTSQDLLELSMLLDKAMGMVKDEKNPFVIFDSVSTLFVYNKTEAIEKFVHSLTGKIRDWKAKGLLLMVESPEEIGVVKIISQFCDHVIEVSLEDLKRK